MTRKGKVYFKDVFCGEISETDDGFAFVYDEKWLSNPLAKPISLTLPLQKEPYISKTMFSFFDGLIPEGWLMSIAEKN